MNILIAEPMAAAGIELLKSQPGWNVIVSNPKEYAQHLAEADALLVRSAVQVTPAVLEKAPKLRVIGRAGVGVDNVDLDAATAAGVLVMNTPGGNAVSVAEHTLALMLAMARHIPQASASTRAGKWEKKKLMGNELRGKTAGHHRPGQHRPRGGEAGPRLRNAHRGARSVRHLEDRAGPRRGTGGSRRALCRERLHYAARGFHSRDPGNALARRLRGTGRKRRKLAQVRPASFRPNTRPALRQSCRGNSVHAGRRCVIGKLAQAIAKNRIQIAEDHQSRPGRAARISPASPSTSLSRVPRPAPAPSRVESPDRQPADR